jgi:hypothetical protein
MAAVGSLRTGGAIDNESSCGRTKSNSFSKEIGDSEIHLSFGLTGDNPRIAVSWNQYPTFVFTSILFLCQSGYNMCQKNNIGLAILKTTSIQN